MFKAVGYSSVSIIRLCRHACCHDHEAGGHTDAASSLGPEQERYMKALHLPVKHADVVT